MHEPLFTFGLSGVYSYVTENLYYRRVNDPDVCPYV